MLRSSQPSARACFNAPISFNAHAKSAGFDPDVSALSMRGEPTHSAGMVARLTSIESAMAGAPGFKAQCRFCDARAARAGNAVSIPSRS
jgi:hypothetical protein